MTQPRIFSMISGGSIPRGVHSNLLRCLTLLWTNKKSVSSSAFTPLISMGHPSSGHLKDRVSDMLKVIFLFCWFWSSATVRFRQLLSDRKRRKQKLEDSWHFWSIYDSSFCIYHGNWPMGKLGLTGLGSTRGKFTWWPEDIRWICPYYPRMKRTRRYDTSTDNFFFIAHFLIWVIPI